MKKVNVSGFTLIEITVVVVIVSFIIAGVVAGQTVLHASMMRTVITDAQKYQRAVMDFKEKFLHLPGDMVGAGGYWLLCTDDGANLCGGDSDGMIESIPAGNDETHRAWQHMALSRILDGKER